MMVSVLVEVIVDYVAHTLLSMLQQVLPSRERAYDEARGRLTVTSKYNAD